MEKFVSDYENSLEKVTEEVYLLWAQGWYDGPMSGLARYKNQILYFQIDERQDKDDIYILYKLPKTQEQEELEKQKLWIECCGNYVFNLPSDYKPTKDISEYYDKYPLKKAAEPFDLRKASAIYWFTDKEFKF